MTVRALRESWAGKVLKEKKKSGMNEVFTLLVCYSGSFKALSALTLI